MLARLGYIGARYWALYIENISLSTFFKNTFIGATNNLIITKT
jgi:hypothetical protein